MKKFKERSETKTEFVSLTAIVRLSLSQMFKKPPIVKKEVSKPKSSGPGIQTVIDFDEHPVFRDIRNNKFNF